MRFKDEKQLNKYGIAIDPADPTRAVPIGQSVDGQQETHLAENLVCSVEPNAGAEPAECNVPSLVQSFARETLSGPVGNLSNWDDQTVMAEIKKECAEIRATDANYPAQYHKLGVLIIEARKRFGDENLRQVLRQEGIDGTRAWRAEQIATLYTYEQAVAFPSLRAILGTLPRKQPRDKKPKPALKSGSDHPGATPAEPVHVALPATADDNIVESFVTLGVKVKELFGDDGLDQAVERIKNHTSDKFDDVFVEV
jgi:hypothetical protein